MATVFEAGLATATNPSQLDDGECPWARYGRADRSSWAAVLGPSLVVTDQSAARTILADPRFHQGIRVAMERNPGIDPRFLARRKEGLLLRDGPDHVRMRRLSTRVFTPRAADRHRPFMREVMERLADDVPAAGVCDAIETLTQTYPIHVICTGAGFREKSWRRFCAVWPTRSTRMSIRSSLISSNTRSSTRLMMERHVCPSPCSRLVTSSPAEKFE